MKYLCFLPMRLIFSYPANKMTAIERTSAAATARDSPTNAATLTLNSPISGIALPSLDAVVDFVEILPSALVMQ